MGKMKYTENVLKFFEKTPVVAVKDIRMIVKDLGYTHLLLHNLIKKGRINQITKGFYTIHSDPSISVFCFKPAYIGLQDALSIHNLWEQETNTIIVTAKKIRPGMRNVMNANIFLRRIDKKYLFGWDMIKNGDFYIPVSDIEKTLIDLVYYNEAIEKEAVRNIKKNIDNKKLRAYLSKYPKKFKIKVMRVVE